MVRRIWDLEPVVGIRSGVKPAGAFPVSFGWPNEKTQPRQELRRPSLQEMADGRFRQGPLQVPDAGMFNPKRRGVQRSPHKAMG